MPEELASLGYVSLSLAELGGRVQPPLALPVLNPKRLPLTELDPETFEWLIAEIVSRQDNRGVQFYGRSGQTQHGLDIVAREPDQRRSLYQVKRYQELTVPRIKEAVETYAGAPRSEGHTEPARLFDPYRFVVVTSAQLDSDTAYVKTVSDLQDAYVGDLEIEFWGAEAVGRKLRDATNLVTAVFGEVWAKAWCGVMPVPNDAAAPKPLGLVSGPIGVLGLQSLEDSAQASEEDPARAARLYGELADALIQGNFPGHAAQVRVRQARMAQAAGDADEAFDLLFDLQVHEILRGQQSARAGSLEALAPEGTHPRAAKWTVLECVADWYEQGSRLPRTVPALRQLAAAADPHAGLLCCLVLEQALVDELYDDPAGSLVVTSEDAPPVLLSELRELADGADSRDVFIRARLACAVADASLRGDCVPEAVQSVYGPLVSAAGAGRYQQARGLITSRAARAFALRGAPDRAAELWNQSVLASSEDGWFGDARFSLRAARQLANDQGRLVFGLEAITRALPNRKQLLAGTFDPALAAYGAAHHGKLPDAFGDTRRYLWESRLQGAWQEELLAMELFGDVLAAGGHPAAAVEAYLRAGAAQKAAQVAAEMQEPVDVSAWLQSPVRRCVAAAVQVVEAQEALATDANAALAVSSLVDVAKRLWRTPAARPHPELDAIKAIRKFAFRLPASAVDSVLSLLEPAIEQNTRYNGEAAELLVNMFYFIEDRRDDIATALGAMMQLPDQHNLWDLLQRLPSDTCQTLMPAVEEHATAGVQEAVEVLNTWRPTTADAQRRSRSACAALLRQPVKVPKTVMRLGTGDSATVGLLLRLLACPEEDLVDVSPDSLDPEQTAAAGEAIVETHVVAAESDHAADTEVPSSAERTDGTAVVGPDETALLAAGPLTALAVAVAQKLTSMVEDHYDSGSSRNSRALALKRLLSVLPHQLAEEISHRLIAVHRTPRLSEMDRWEIDSDVPLSRSRFRSGAADLVDNALRVAVEAWALSRQVDAPLTQADEQFTLEAITGASSLLQDSGQERRSCGARCISALARGSSQFAPHAIGLALHNCEYVRAVGVQHVPQADPLLIALASDHAPRVRAAVAERSEELPQHVQDALREDPHLGVRKTLSRALTKGNAPTTSPSAG
ncbi:hypothetical protein [Streptomyces sp. NPDC088847]|uniref:hypothetical protein n=1 Tax=Streptomyces sp. NPDC088847 TaxID=3365909 RepID=UPI0038033279